ncbi:MAG: acyl-CoA thioesterase [SAR324 cluster bacterium]|nr:acyl-CoA thioesterase [SAR324 cluster bacterium]
MTFIKVETLVRVTYGDTDAMGHAYYGNFFRWFEVGRTEWFRATGMDYRSLEQHEGIFLPVIEAHCDYKNPAFYDDLLSIHTGFEYNGRAKMQFNMEIFRQTDNQLLATGHTVHVCLDRQRKILKIPPFLKTLMDKQILPSLE